MCYAFYAYGFWFESHQCRLSFCFFFFIFFRLTFYVYGLVLGCPAKGRACLRRFDDVTGVAKPIFCVEQWEVNGGKNNCTAKGDIAPRLKKSVFKFDNFWLSEFHNGLGTKKKLQLWMYKIFKHCKLSCIPCFEETHNKLQWYNIFPSLFFFVLLLQRNFFPLLLRHQTSATKLHYLRSYAFYRESFYLQ